MTFNPKILAYGFFAAPAAISLLLIQVYLPSHLANLGSLELTTIGLVFFAARLVDTVSDPLIGYLSDITSSPFGRRRIWIIVSLPFFLFFLYCTLNSTSEAGELFLYLSLCYISGTAVIVPYYAWGAEIEKGYKRHNQFAASRAFFGLKGTVLAFALPAVLLDSTLMSDTILLNYLVAAIGFSLAVFLILKLPDTQKTSPNVLGIRKSFAVFEKGSSFNTLMISQLVNATANALPASLFLLFVAHVLEQPSLAGALLMLYFLAAVVAIPFWNKLITRYKKEQCWRWAMTIASIVFLATFLVSSDNLWLFVIITFITGFMAGADLTLPASMLADLAQLDQEKTGQKRSGVYFAIWGTTSKLSFALAIGVAFPLLDLGALLPNSGDLEINKNWLVSIYAIVPAGLKLMSVWVLRNYQIPLDKLKGR